MPPRKRQKGNGFMDVVKKGINALRDTQLISKVAGMIPDPRAQKVAGVAGALGFGRKRKVGRPRKTTGVGQAGGFFPGLSLLTGLLGGNS